jgi:hypothetical protein
MRPSSLARCSTLLTLLVALSPIPVHCQSGPSQNSGISSSDTWAAFDLSVQTQATINNTTQFFNPVTQSNATTYTLSGVPRTYHIELGFDVNGGAVMNLWPTGASPDPAASDTSLISMIRFANGSFTIFDSRTAFPFPRSLCPRMSLTRTALRLPSPGRTSPPSTRLAG